TGLAHESRSALQRTHACLELLSLKMDPRPDLLGLVSDIRTAQDHLQHLYQAVRGYAAPIKLRMENVGIGKLLESTWEYLSHWRQGRETRLLIEAGSDGLSWPLDPLAFGQVIRNILENSLSACEDAVEVTASWTVATLQGVPFLELSLADNGPGLTP